MDTPRTFAGFMKGIKMIANITSLVGIFSFSVGLFFVFVKLYTIQRSRSVTQKWADQVYAQTYESGYEHGSLKPSETIIIDLKVEPIDIRYDMHVVKDAEIEYIPMGFLALLVVGGFITTVVGSYLNGKTIGLPKQ